MYAINANCMQSIHTNCMQMLVQAFAQIKANAEEWDEMQKENASIGLRDVARRHRANLLSRSGLTLLGICPDRWARREHPRSHSLPPPPQKKKTQKSQTYVG